MSFIGARHISFLLSDTFLLFLLDEETGGYVSYQCVLPMNVHGSGYTQMQMISNSKAEKLVIQQLLFDVFLILQS